MRENHPGHRILVLGAGYTGLTAALSLAGRIRRHRAEVALVNASDRFVERLRLHQVAAGQRVVERPIPKLLAGSGIEFTRGRVTGLAPKRREVMVDSAGEPRTLRYDTLLYALGSTIDLDTVPGAAEHAHALTGLEAAARLAGEAAELAARGGELVVCGGGFTGIEVASELAESYPGLSVRLVTRGAVGAGLPGRARDYLRAAFTRLGVEVREDTEIVEVRAGRLVLARGESIPFGVCVWAGSFRVPELAARAGFDVDDRGRVIVDTTLRSVSHPEVYAVGDAASVPTPWGEPLRMTCQAGIPTAAHAARVIADRLRGREPKPFRFGYVHVPLSLGRDDGLIQFLRADDTPRPRMLAGGLAARYKETVTASGAVFLPLLRRWPGLLVAPKGGRRTRGEAKPQPVSAGVSPN